MSPRKKIEPGELFYRFYRKRISSFLVTVYKAGITGKDKDIHKLRVDLKKVNALFNFFGMLEFSGFSIGKSARHFRDIFRQAGKIREMQVNLRYLEQTDASVPGILSFRRFLKKEQKKYIKEFIAAIARFDEKKLKPVDRSIKRCCRLMDSAGIMTRSGDFLHKKSCLIRTLAEHPENDENIHRIRQELKKMGAISSLLLQVGPGQDIRQLVAKLNETEVLIGEWHDRVVLLDSMEHFVRSSAGMDERSSAGLKRLKESIATDNSEILTAIMPKVVDLTETVITRPSTDELV